MPAKLTPGRAGDRIEVSSPSGELPRHGVIEDVIGPGGHVRSVVPWVDGRRSIDYPSDGTRIRPRTRRGSRRVYDKAPL